MKIIVIIALILYTICAVLLAIKNEWGGMMGWICAGIWAIEYLINESD